MHASPSPNTIMSYKCRIIMSHKMWTYWCAKFCRISSGVSWFMKTIYKYFRVALLQPGKGAIVPMSKKYICTVWVKLSIQNGNKPQTKQKKNTAKARISCILSGCSVRPSTSIIFVSKYLWVLQLCIMRIVLAIRGNVSRFRPRQRCEVFLSNLFYSNR